MPLRAANGASVYATPSRGERMPFPQSSNPSPSPAHTPHHHSTSTSTSSFASSSSTLPTSSSSASVNTDRPMTVAALLKANAAAPDPASAALDQAVNDRNALSSQNSQLWKLIEKQRSGYNQILKELERVRGERDAYKAKLGGSTNGRKSSDGERAPKRSLSGGTPTGNVPGSDSKQTRSTQISDDPSTPKSHHQLHSSRSHEPLANRDRDQTNANYSGLTRPLAVPRSQQQYLPPPPASAPSSVNADPSSNMRSYKPFPTPLVVPSRSESYGSEESRALYYARKSSLPESIQSEMSINTGNSSTSAPPSLAAQHYHNGASTPQTAPAGFSNVHSDQQPQHLQRTSNAPVKSQPYPQITTAATSTSDAHPPTLSPTTSNPNGLLPTIPEAHSNTLSRDSRVSLPDEAKQYIANMTDSLDASSKVSSKPPRSVRSQIPEHSSGYDLQPSATLAESDSPRGTAGFLDMNEDEEDESEVDDDRSALTGPDETDFEGVDGGSPGDLRQRIQGIPQVEDFPLPPANVIQVQDGANQVLKVTHAQDSTRNLDPTLAPRANIEQLSGYATSSQQSLSMHSDTNHHQQSQPVAANFRALPLLSTDLPYTTVTVSHSFVRPNDRGKEVLSFVVHVDPGQGKVGWKVEKMYSDVLGLDQRVRSSVGKGAGKKIASLPEGKLWKDHAPAKVDQRKAVLENYLQMLINLPIKHNDEVIAFFTSDIMRETKQPVMQAGHKEGYLTKRGKNFGGWKTRYFVLQGPALEYYDCRGGAHLGSITITGAQIGRQQRTERAPGADDEKEYRHAFLIVEAKKGPGGNHPRHVLCAESDEDRDSWVEMLVRYFTGTYTEEPVVKFGPGPTTAAYQIGSQPRTSSSSADSPSSRRPRGVSKDEISISKGAAVPISQLPQDQINSKLFPPAAPPTLEDYPRSTSPVKVTEPDRQGSGGLDPQNYNARRLAERAQPSSLPDSSPLSLVTPFTLDPSLVGQRANSELGHYPDLQGGLSKRQLSPERHRTRDMHDKQRAYHPTLNAVVPSPSPVSPVDRVPSPDKLEKVKISGPLNGVPIPSGFKFGGKDKDASVPSETAAAERRAKSRSFWGFGKGDKGIPAVTSIPRAVFGASLDEALDIAQIANLPAIVFRAIQYLEAKKADQEEGIYRLSGSSAVIKSLRDRFNLEGDVDLVASDEYWDPHAIAGLLKSFLRELPASILTRKLHMRFLAVIDFVDAQERIKELSQLIAALPFANYSLLRALTAHLILIVQNSGVNKMTMRNVGIVFSPTLGIPAGVFSLMLGEFNRVFNVEAGGQGSPPDGADGTSDVDRRNSRQYMDAAADQLLGLTGRSLQTPSDDALSEGDELSVHDESGTETTDGDFGVEASTSESTPMRHAFTPSTFVTPPDTPTAVPKLPRISHVAASKGLNVSVTGVERGNRHSKIGLPASPRPPQSPRPPDGPAS